MRYGESPPARGNPLSSLVVSTERREIPAWAGEPAVSTSRQKGNPHLRGGRRSPCIALSAGKGTIPACARKSSLPGCHLPTIEGNPRRNEERPIFQWARSKKEGESPPARGNRWPRYRADEPHRTIPAETRKERSFNGQGPRKKDNPRLRGGTSGHRCGGARSTRQSPPARGNRLPSEPRSRDGRTIPACAGEPFLRPLRTT